MPKLFTQANFLCLIFPVLIVDYVEIEPSSSHDSAKEKSVENLAKIKLIQSQWRAYKQRAKLAEVASRAQQQLSKKNSKETSSSNTLERATNQNDILKEMMIAKEEDKEDVIHGYNSSYPKSTADRIEMIQNSWRAAHDGDERAPNERNHSHSNNLASKSVSNIEKDLDEDKSKKHELIAKSLRLLKKKRPNSAKVLGEKSSKESSANEAEMVNELISKLKTIRTDKTTKTGRKDESTKNNTKPPFMPKTQRSDKSLVRDIMSRFFVV